MLRIINLISEHMTKSVKCYSEKSEFTCANNMVDIMSTRTINIYGRGIDIHNHILGLEERLDALEKLLWRIDIKMSKR